jgi:hypothetical protein
MRTRKPAKRKRSESASTMPDAPKVDSIGDLRVAYMSMPTGTLLAMLKERKVIDDQFEVPLKGTNNKPAWMLARHDRTQRTLPDLPS